MTSSPSIHLLGVIAVGLLLPGQAGAQKPFAFAGAPCAKPAALHCPDSECSSALVINQGQVVEMKTRRTYFLDYPCDLKQGEKVTFILSLHGGGSFGNWQRHYFPLMDFKDKHRLVIATPNSPTRSWSEADDAYLQNIVEFVIEQIGKQNIKAFWLVGHSQGGMTSNRLLRTDFFKTKVDGWLSLSGGRLGGNPERSATFNPGSTPMPAAPDPKLTATAQGTAAAPGAGPSAAMFAAAAALLRELPPSDLSFIYATGQREVDDKGVPSSSDLAAKYGCGPRQAPRAVVDTRAGYVYDSSRLNLLRPGWGLLPGPGQAQIYVYPSCRQGRVIADVIRNDKGHTEGLEPNVTEELIKLMLSAPGAKIAQGK